ncbi:Sporulation-specific N-acetylmuramoyl-L-alanine amidase [Paraliobacillus sp. PM-2]|uniref:N-acetylmuramoyl-L-alanine amidase n=1 Tax=Paraliobacillus sp. PM-2 TaxID=1462524 RepID=UPI00061BC5ED|nr:N-acetylmuramoyl-L-alanine amidase [Paraliobacillus sp. PM-2]CQR47606.1 Sporulation-specific N-acetylmuramoyl-L-alanine amidase [Paraliobacillus sp. PM-2]
MVKIFIDPGHGGGDPGASANGLLEKDITLKIALQLRKMLQENYKDTEVRLSRINDETKSLTQRTDEANRWNADYLLSVHINAGGGEGFESYIWNGDYRRKSSTDKLRTTIHRTIVKQLDWRNRGTKEANFHMLRESKMPAVLTENGFIDNAKEAKRMKTDDWIKEVAEAHASGLEAAFDLEKRPDLKPDQETFYRVVCGSFQEHKNAKQRMNILSKRGYDSFIDLYIMNNKRYYRVIVGSFRDKENADSRMRQLKKIGFDCFIDAVRP